MQTLVMKEVGRISKLFDNLYDGSPWLEVTLMGTLALLTAEQASAKRNPQRNSIWEITNHMIAWRLNVLKRVQGEIIKSPEHNYILPIDDISEDAWTRTLLAFEDSQQKWSEFLRTFDDAALSGIYPVNGHTHYEHIHGIIQHDAYHLGQIILLAKHPE